MEEIADKLSMFTGINVFSYPTDSVSPPAGILSYPEKIQYDETYGRGEDIFETLPLYMITNRTDSKSARNQMSDWTDPKGNRSVKTFLDTQKYSFCEAVLVTNATFDTVDIAGVEYTCVVFELNISGEG